LIAWLANALLLFSISGPMAECGEHDREDDYHLTSVCENWLEGAPAYSATVQGSLMAKPASQQVTIVRLEGEWLMLVAGYRWDEDGSVTTRRVERVISDEDGERIASLLSEEAFHRLGKLHYYGSEDVICTDGANYELAAGVSGQKMTARQHSCAGATEINQVMAVFRELALKYDTASEGMLYWLKE
jgi:hypothetical protein